MSVFKVPKSPFYQYEFQINGHRFRGSTEATSKKAAEAVERTLKEKAKEDAKLVKTTGNGPLLLRHAAGRYFSEVGEGHVNSADTFRALERLVSFFGPDKRMDEITDDDLANLIAWRRTLPRFGKKKRKDGSPMPPVSNATINRDTTAVLKKLMGFAKRRMKYQFRLEPNWRDHWLKEADERVRELNPDEGDALDTAIRPDYALWLEFARLTGWRLETTLLRWTDINAFAKQISRIGKQGRKVTTPITPSVAAILDQCKGHHPEYVFTFIAQRTDKTKGRVRGQRYPITYEGAKTQWERTRKRSGVDDFRFHDIRHDVATKTLRATKNLKLVSKVLGHSNISTTMRYAHVLDDEVSQALEAVALSRKSPQNIPHTKKKKEA